MKIMTLLGLIALLTAILTIGELNGSSILPQETASQSIVELENCENEFDSATACRMKAILFHPIEFNVLYAYKHDSILFDLYKDFFRPPSLT